jgi:Ca2+-binding RTX toxin-like protein
MLNNNYLELLQRRLAQLATQANFETILTTAFGHNISHTKISKLRQQWLNGDFSLIPPIEILTHGELGNANGGYAASEDKIFISSDFIAQKQNNSNAVTGLLLEEFGHKLDRFFNGNIDSLGDEGDIFRRLVTGQHLSSQTLAALRSEDDHAIITVNGQSVAIEAQNFTGTSGNDTLPANPGTNTGNDNFVPGRGADSIDGGMGTDSLEILNLGDNVDTIITYTTTTNGSITGGANNGTTFQNIEQVKFTTGSGNDNINISAATGYNFVHGGSGNDTIVGSATSSQYLYGESGDDSLTGGTGGDNLFGGIGNDTLTGNAGDDTLTGDAGNDSISGGTGNDDVIGGTGIDTIDGGEGTADTLQIFNTSDTTATIISYNTNLNQGSISGGFNSGTTFKNVEQVYFDTGSGADNINLAAATLTRVAINTRAGNDTIVGSTTATYQEIRAGEGDDSITGGNGNDELLGELGNDTITGGAGNDRLIGDRGNDLLTGGNDDDVFFPGVGADSIDGGAGNDLLNIYNSGDTNPSTIIYINTTNGTIVGGVNNGTTFQNIERFDVNTGTVNDNINLSAATGTVTIRAYGGNDTIVGSLTATNALFGQDGNDNITGGNNNDDINGGIGNDTLNGGAGNDTINAGTGADIIDGGTANDILFIDNTNDTAATTITYTTPTQGTINGGVSNGTTFQNIERIQIRTGSGIDNINLSAATELTDVTIYAGAGNDIIVGSAVALYQTISGREGDDNITGGNNVDNLNGDSGNDTLNGNAGNDSIYAGDNNDYVIGGTGNDGVRGDAGNDTLIGVNLTSSNPGLGERDYLEGGAGIDRFILGDSANVYYDDRNTTTGGTTDYATIYDFNPNEDIVQLQGNASNYLLQTSGNSTNLYINKPGTEPDELIAVFSSVTGLNLTSNSFVYAPINQVGVNTTIAFSNANYSVNENGTPVTAITLNRTGSTNPASVTVTPSNGTASNADYTNTPIVVNFLANENSKTISVPIINDTLAEGNESINLTLSNASNGVVLGGQSTATLTIVDNDRAVVFSSATYAVNEDGTPINAVTINRIGDLTIATSVTVASSNGSASNGDYTNTPIVVNFLANESSKTIAIPITEDTLTEDNETVNLTLFNPTGGAIVGSQSTATLTIVDNDIPRISIADLQVVEGQNSNALVTVTLSNPSTQIVTVKYSTSNVTAQAGSDYTGATNITLTFNPGEVSKTISIPLIDNNLNEPDESFNITLSTPTNATILDGSSTITISDTLVTNATTVLHILVENLTLTGTANLNGTGNSNGNVITGNSGNNSLTGGISRDTLNGGVGNDTLNGRDGNDTYVIDADVDFGTDTIGDGGYPLGSDQDMLDFRTTTKAINVNLGTSVTQTVAAGVQLVRIGGIDGVYGGAGNDILTGVSSYSYLSGGAGNDTLNGVSNFDTYIIDADIDLGTDTINDVLPPLTAMNSLDFRTTTTKAINVDLSKTTTQTVATGVQLVIPVISINGTYGGTQNDTLKGNSWHNLLDGGEGNDILDGGAGNDTYIVDSTGDIVTESANSGTDTVISSVNHTLAVNVETLILVRGVNGTGNAIANTINGGVGNNVINGGAGNDTLSGGDGSDTFAFGGSSFLNLLSAIGVDSIIDFAIGEDKIQLSKASFTPLTAGNPLGASFTTVATDAAAATATASIVYNSTNGNLFYNADGNIAGFGSRGGRFADLFPDLLGVGVPPALTSNNFTVVA